MLLYELAISLDKRSPDLVDAAAELGMGELQPATDLDAAQVAALRAHFGSASAPPPLAPLGSGATPLPAPPSGPLAGEPLVFGAPAAAPASGAPQAPASWGPPPGAAPPPPPAGPGAAAPPPPAVGPVTWDPEGHVGPHFTAPEVPAGTTGTPPGPAAMPAPGLPPTSLPPTGPAGAAGPALPAGPGAPGPTTGLATGQKVLIGGAVAAVVALFGFMAINTGPDREREQELAAKEAAIEAELGTTTAPKSTTTTSPAAPTTDPPAQDAYSPVDVQRFCQGGLGVATFELRLAAAIADGNFDEVTGLVRDRRAGWNGDLDTMSSGAAPILVDDIARYRQGYDLLFDAIDSSSSLDEAYGKIDRVTLARATNAAKQVGAQVEFACK